MRRSASPRPPAITAPPASPIDDSAVGVADLPLAAGHVALDHDVEAGYEVQAGRPRLPVRGTAEADQGFGDVAGVVQLAGRRAYSIASRMSPITSWPGAAHG